MQVHVDDEIYSHYHGEDLEHAKKIIERIRDSADRLSRDMVYDLTIRDMEVIERLAKQTDATDADVFYIYCEGFARGRDYENDKKASAEVNSSSPA
ncbi:MAG TPA: hypothetical protein DEP61_02640 [Lachnospiraceae bacterium]|nr:hypothetical protein [Lachnospiraceae bacterium]